MVQHPESEVVVNQSCSTGYQRDYVFTTVVQGPRSLDSDVCVCVWGCGWVGAFVTEVEWDWRDRRNIGRTEKDRRNGVRSSPGRTD